MPFPITPLELANFGARKDWEAHGDTKAKPFDEKVLATFEEAIARLEQIKKDKKEDEKKAEAGQEENGQDGGKDTIVAPSDEVSLS
ncbi:hypothetical protein N0V82_009911 [Gnomoniopsis sp. IMI 355080]|nr:hypothetical protein N0V82_009911 [Gnomoniopsis sp. IMI 355080]